MKVCFKKGFKFMAQLTSSGRQFQSLKSMTASTLYLSLQPDPWKRFKTPGLEL